VKVLLSSYRWIKDVPAHARLRLCHKPYLHGVTYHTRVRVELHDVCTDPGSFGHTPFKRLVQMHVLTQPVSDSVSWEYHLLNATISKLSMQG